MVNVESDKWAEIFCAFAIHDNILNGMDITVGEYSTQKLPDIFDNARTFGIEVVQMEQDSDLNIKYIWEKIKECDGDYDQVNKFCNDKYPKQHKIWKRKGKVGSIKTSDVVHDVDWMKDIYERNLTNKLEKLNKGNYSGIAQNDLCISITQRATTLYDVKLILHLYCSMLTNYAVGFRKLIIVASDKIYIANVNNIERTVARKMLQIINGKEEEIIYDIEINGKDYLNSIEYDYHACHKQTEKVWKKKV